MTDIFKLSCYISSPIRKGLYLLSGRYQGYLFYSDWGDGAHIGRLGMDGSARKNVITDHVGWPNALTIDYVTSHIIWADARLDYIAMADLDGNNRAYIVQNNLPHIFAIAGKFIFVRPERNWLDGKLPQQIQYTLTTNFKVFIMFSLWNSIAVFNHQKIFLWSHYSFVGSKLTFNVKHKIPDEPSKLWQTPNIMN